MQIGVIILLTLIYQYLKNRSMIWFTPLYNKIKYTWIRFYRILNVKKRSEFVWKDLIKYNQQKGWRFVLREPLFSNIEMQMRKTVIGIKINDLILVLYKKVPI